jgi:glycogen debranching enzyme
MVAEVHPVGPHGEVTCVSGRTFCLSTASGQIRPGPYGDGVFVEDTRILSALVLTLNGEEPHALGGYPLGPGAARFSACAHVGAAPDPTLLVERRRSVTEVWQERIRVTNHRVDPVEVHVRLRAAADFAYIFDVKHGRHPSASTGRLVEGGLRFDSTAGESALLEIVPMPDDDVEGSLGWELLLPAQGAWEVELTLRTGGPRHDGQLPAAAISSRAAAPGVGSLARPRISCSDVRFERLIERSIGDLDSLLVRDGESRYFAAGTPWFLTLFGRDSLWSAMMAFPLGVEVAGETLQLLARDQGVRHDAVTEEAPGKILHEVRHGPQVDRGDLPPRYYGTIDATPLFVTALEQAWRWGLDERSVEALLPHAERALSWMRDDGDPDDTGFLRYAAFGDGRLSNQGWKDSEDGICFADGTLADAPIALCEVQGYAYRAAIGGAAMLDAHGRPGGEEWRGWADRLRTRFQAQFWVDDGEGGFPALALDGSGRQVDAITSNAAHLLGTGILEPWQEARVAERLAESDMDSGWGLRTLSSRSPRFNPLSYHGGSVWPHDTAIAIDGLARVGAGSTASHLLDGLIAAGDQLGFRLPELFGGEQRTAGTRPLPYPSACSPQAWAAGAALLALRAVLGIEPDVPAGVLHLRPMDPAPFARLTVEGMPLAGGKLSLRLEDGTLRVSESPAHIEVVVHPAGLSSR